MRSTANKTAINKLDHNRNTHNSASITMNESFGTRSNSTTMSKRGVRQQFKSTLYVKTNSNYGSNHLEFKNN